MRCMSSFWATPSYVMLSLGPGRCSFTCSVSVAFPKSSNVTPLHHHLHKLGHQRILGQLDRLVVAAVTGRPFVERTKIRCSGHKAAQHVYFTSHFGHSVTIIEETPCVVLGHLFFFWFCFASLGPCGLHWRRPCVCCVLKRPFQQVDQGFVVRAPRRVSSDH